MAGNKISGLVKCWLALTALMPHRNDPFLTMMAMTVPFPYTISTNFAPIWASGLDTNPAGN